MLKKYERKEAISIGIIGIPNVEIIEMLEKELGKPIKKIVIATEE